MSDDKFSQSKPFDALNSRGLTGKREYVQSLEQRADPEALSLLIECLCDESWYLRDQAEGALRRMGPRVADVLLPLLEQGLWFTRTSAARVLGGFGHRPAVPGLLRLAEDVNEGVADTARASLVAIGRAGGSIAIAIALHGLPPDARRLRFEELAALDRPLSERVERMMRNEELMARDGAEMLSDESEAVRASEEGVVWEVLTGPPRSAAPAEPAPAPARAPGH
ncbi:MAG TPA: HEAT repeat domain-containing protein, partial [Candidatus Eisenbacteria bacterium]|nr:HEAT repeat domain-containing protein [Candidatus Eisenbacteria bacterium]